MKCKAQWGRLRLIKAKLPCLKFKGIAMDKPLTLQAQRPFLSFVVAVQPLSHARLFCDTMDYSPGPTGWLSGRRQQYRRPSGSALQYRRLGFDPWVGKIPGWGCGDPFQLDREPGGLQSAAAAAKSPQSCPTLRPHRWQPTRLPRPWDSPGKNTGVGCHCLLPTHESEKWKWRRSVVSDSVRPHGLQPTRLLHPWDSPGKRTGVGGHRLLRGHSL